MMQLDEAVHRFPETLKLNDDLKPFGYSVNNRYLDYLHNQSCLLVGQSSDIAAIIDNFEGAPSCFDMELVVNGLLHDWYEKSSTVKNYDDAVAVILASLHFARIVNRIEIEHRKLRKTNRERSSHALGGLS